MNSNMIKTAEQYEKTAQMLLNKAKMLRAGIDPNKCKHGTYTDKFWGKECKPCGSPKTAICAIKAGGRASHSSRDCNPIKCENFKPAKE